VDGKRKGAIKAHTQARLSDMAPHFIHFTAGASNDKDFLKVMELPEGSIGVFDRAANRKGFHNYARYQQWNESNRFYVTRLNDNAKFKVIEQLRVEHFHEDGVISDQLIELSYKCKNEKTTKKVKARLICFIDPVSGRKLAFLTNMFEAKALTVCLLYQNRWSIEVLFKQLKQNFELTYFLSDSENGIKIQIWVALILNLLFEVIHRQIKEAEDFAAMVKIAAKNLCSYVSLVKFLMNPFAEWLKEKEKELNKMQLNLFEPDEGDVFANSV
jgi:IS4 transposase